MYRHVGLRTTKTSESFVTCSCTLSIGSCPFPLSRPSLRVSTRSPGAAAGGGEGQEAGVRGGRFRSRRLRCDSYDPPEVWGEEESEVYTRAACQGAWSCSNEKFRARLRASGCALRLIAIDSRVCCVVVVYKMIDLAVLLARETFHATHGVAGMDSNKGADQSSSLVWYI